MKGAQTGKNCCDFSYQISMSNGTDSSISTQRSILFESMVEKGIYPMYSRKNKLFLRCTTKGLLTAEKTQEIIKLLNINTKEDCERLREAIKKKVAERKQSRPIKEWIEEERPREMLIKQGAENLPLSKLLAIILRTGNVKASAEELAKILLNRFGGLRAIDSADISELSKIDGIGPVKAVQIKAALEIGKRFYRETAQIMQKKLKNPEDVVNYVAEYYSPYIRDKDKEFCYMILLDIKNRPIKNVEISRGSINYAIVDPKEIVKNASLISASSVILIHNHPSGETTPSQNDIEITNRIVQVCNLVGIKVLDHIIVGKNIGDFYSFAKEGLIK